MRAYRWGRTSLLALLSVLLVCFIGASRTEQLTWSLSGPEGWSGGTFVNTMVEANPGALVLARGPHVLWQARYDSGHLDIARAIAVDSSNNIIAVGYTRLGRDAYSIVKYDPRGRVLWNHSYNLGTSERAVGVAVDSQDNIVVVGYSAQGGNYLYHLHKYDARGNLLWSRTYSGGERGQACAVAVDSQDNIVVAGTANSDFLVIKYNSAGQLLWVRRHDGGGTEQAYGLAIDTQDRIIVVGVSNSFTLHGIDDRDYYIVKYDSKGQELWVRHYDGGDEDVAQAVAVDANDNIIVTGYSGYYNNYDFYTIKYNARGELLWARRWDSGGRDLALGVTVDSRQDIIVVGTTVNDNHRGYYVIKYDPQGRELWAIPLSGNSNPTSPPSGSEMGIDVALDLDDNPIVVLNADGDYRLYKCSDGFLPWGSYLTPAHGFGAAARLRGFTTIAELRGQRLEATIQLSDDRFTTIKDILHLQLYDGKHSYNISNLHWARYVRVRFEFKTANPQVSPLLKGFVIRAEKR